MSDLAGRMLLLERKLRFVMENIRMKGAIGNGLLKADGSPDMRIIEGSLEEFYRLSRTAETFRESDLDLPGSLPATDKPLPASEEL